MDRNLGKRWDLSIMNGRGSIFSQLQLDTDEMTVENAITRSFDKIVKLHLDPVWHQLSPKTKQLIADIKTLKLMLE